MIKFTRLPRFSACNVEKLREPGDETKELCKSILSFWVVY